MINNKGQTFLLALMVATVFVILALAFAPVIKQFGDEARNDTTDTQIGLNCSSDTLTKFDEANCVAIDMMNPYFVGFMIFAGIGAILAARFIGQ